MNNCIIWDPGPPPELDVVVIANDDAKMLARAVLACSGLDISATRALVDELLLLLSELT